MALSETALTDTPEILPQPNSELTEAPVDGVRAFDQTGREVIVPREEWRTNVLPAMLREVWDQPDQMHMLLINSFNDGFFAEVADAAEHMHETDPKPARGTSMWAIVLIETGRLDEAKAVLDGYLASHPEEPSVLFHLGRVQAAQGNAEAANAAVLHALELDPNHDQALGWYATQAQLRSGDQAANEALAAVARMPASWRAQVWLARAALMGSDLNIARQLYLAALDRAPRPVPIDLLMQMSGDLGGRGHLAELIDLTAPYYLPETHGLPVGNNLIKANVDLGRLGSAEMLTGRLAQMNRQRNRPDWTQALNYWAGEIGRRRGVGTAVADQADGQQQGVQLGLLRVDGPVWLPANSPARGIFGQKPAEGLVVSYLGGTAEAPEAGEDSSAGRTELIARLTRAIPLFLAEQTELATSAHGRAALPWAVGGADRVGTGFVVANAAWTDEMAAQMLANPASPTDYAVTVHLDAEVEPWTAMLAFVRTSNGTRIGEIETEFDPEAPEEGLDRLAAEVVELLGSAVGKTDAEAVYEVPGGAHFMPYLTQMEHLLAIRCASMEAAPSSFLSGMETVVRSALELATALPANVPARLLLLETMAAVDKLQPAAAAQFGDSARALAAAKPLAALDRVFS